MTPCLQRFGRWGDTQAAAISPAVKDRIPSPASFASSDQQAWQADSQAGGTSQHSCHHSPLPHKGSAIQGSSAFEHQHQLSTCARLPCPFPPDGGRRRRRRHARASPAAAQAPPLCTHPALIRDSIRAFNGGKEGRGQRQACKALPLAAAAASSGGAAAAYQTASIDAETHIAKQAARPPHAHALPISSLRLPAAISQPPLQSNSVPTTGPDMHLWGPKAPTINRAPGLRKVHACCAASSLPSRSIALKASVPASAKL